MMATCICAQIEGVPTNFPLFYKIGNILQSAPDSEFYGHFLMVEANSCEMNFLP